MSSRSPVSPARPPDCAVAFASAAETVRSLEGDCSEHAVLCAAMARAAGMPSRVVSGLVYLPPGGGLGGERGVFGYHLWAEALVGPDAWLRIRTVALPKVACAIGVGGKLDPFRPVIPDRDPGRDSSPLSSHAIPATGMDRRRR